VASFSVGKKPPMVAFLQSPENEFFSLKLSHFRVFDWIS